MFRNIMHQECKYEKRKWEIYSSFGLSADINNQEMVFDKDPPALPTVFNALSVIGICSPQSKKEEALLVIPLHIKVLRHNERRLKSE